MLICPGGVARVLGACTIFLEGSNFKKKKKKKKRNNYYLKMKNQIWALISILGVTQFD